MTKDVKFLEIRDAGTFIPAMAVAISGHDGYLARRAGFGAQMIYLVAISAARANYDPFSWDNRTMSFAHQVIERDWNALSDGDVVDVEYHMGKTAAPKKSEQLTAVDYE